ncbi:thiamine diphosphokinase [Alkaliphilus pronyensis]|nr:thiamine diphosphokinase [Alkaliphilus pronyensis]
MKVLIIANGHISSMDFLESQIKQHSYIICADGAAKYLVSLHKRPNLLLGDFDSISKKDMNWMLNEGVKVERYSTRKDKTDTDIALDYAIALNPQLITIVGCMGSRWDHSLGNLMLLNRLLEMGIKGALMDEKNIATITNSELEVEATDANVSIIPLSSCVKGVTLEGMEYPLNNYDISRGSSIGISNRLLSKKGKITVKDGVLLVIISWE